MSEEGVEQKYIKKAFDDNYVVPMGPNVTEFEGLLEKFVGVEKLGCKVAALSAGTAAVHLALTSLGVGPGDEVCVQSFTFCASSHPITYLGASETILGQTKGTAFLFFDQEVRESLSVIDNYDKLGLLVQSPDLASMALKTGMDEASLSRSIQRYNGFQSCGNDADFHRSSVQMPVPLSKAPYYAVEVKPAIHHTMGGIHIDSKARVLDRQGRSVEGLFACGEVTGGVHGGNRLGGNGVADIVVFGRIAGREASLCAIRE